MIKLLEIHPTPWRVVNDGEISVQDALGKPVGVFGRREEELYVVL
jgi:hypothetical protein